MENHDTPEAVEKRALQEDPIVMYLIVNETLGMSIGKTAAQCAHASQMLQLKFSNEEAGRDYNWIAVPINVLFQEWLNSSFRKVVLRADDKEWVKLKQLPNHVVVVDAGLTEIASGSETVIGFMPMRKSEVPKVIKKLQVLK
jgi:PTH2 family peptidyl-tRNA hydrolase